MVAPTCGTYGGIEVFTCEIARQVLEAGDIDLRVVLRLRPGFRRQASLDQGLAKSGVTWRLMNQPDAEYMRDLAWADLVNCHFPLAYATYPARLLGKKLVVTVENRRIPAEHRMWHEWGMRIAHERWYISGFVAKTWEGEKLRRGSSVVPAASDLPCLSVPPADRKGLFFIARWIPLKGIEQLVEAYATADIDRSNHRLALFGDGPLREEVESLIERHKVGEWIDRPGFVDHETKVSRMASSKWNVAPAAFEEDLGLSPIEARACGVPSIVTRIGGLPEAAGSRALTCIPGDIPSLRLALENALATSEKEYAELAAWASESLTDYLPPADFYSMKFRELLQ